MEKNMDDERKVSPVKEDKLQIFELQHAKKLSAVEHLKYEKKMTYG